MPEEPQANEEMQPEESHSEETPVEDAFAEKSTGDVSPTDEAEAAPGETAAESFSSMLSQDEIQAAMDAARAETSDEAGDAEANKFAPAAAVSDEELAAVLEAAEMPGKVKPVSGVVSENITVSADEIEAAMREMLEQQGATASSAVAEDLQETAAETGVTDDVEAAMEAMLNQASDSPADVSAGAGADDDVEAAMQAMLDGADEPDFAAAQAPEPAAVQSKPPPDVKPFTPTEFSRSERSDGHQIDMLDDVELEVKIELGRAEMYIEDVLGLGAGSVVELDRAAGDPVDIYVNEKLVARGEVLVLNDNFCVRINDILSPIPELEED